MPTWLDGRPFALVFTALLAIVFLRAQATYWLGRGITTGALHTRAAARINDPRMSRALSALNRWGLPVVTISFVTIGFQTVVNAGAGLSRMRWPRYTAAMVPGCVAWAAIYATIGLAAFNAWLALASRSPWALVALLALLVLIIAVTAALLIRRRRAKPALPTG